MKMRKFFVLLILLVSWGTVFSQVETKTDAEKILAEAESLFAKQTKDDIGKALPKFESVSEICGKLGDVKCQAAAMNRLAEISYMTGNMEKALSYARNVLPLFEKLGDRLMTAETLSNIGGFSDALGDSFEAIKYTERSLVILREVGDKKREAIALNGLGVFYSNVGEINKATGHLTEALELRREINDRPGEARTLLNIGTTYDETGELRKAADFYLAALKISREEKNTRIEAVTLNNLGLVWKELGEYQKAFDIYGESLELRRKTGDQRGEAVTLSNIAAIYSILGDIQQAITISEQTLKIFQTDGYKRNEAITLGSLASMYFQVGEEKRSLEARQRSLELYESAGDKRGQSSALRYIGLSYSDKKESDKAMEFFQRSLAFAEEVNDLQRISLVKLSIARNYQQLNDLTNAKQNYSSALEISRKVGNPDDIVEVLYHYALFDETQDLRAAALEKMSEVIRILEDIRNTIHNDGFRIGFFSNQQKYYDLYVSLLVSQHLKESTKGYDALALFISEKARERSLLDSLGESRLNNNSGVFTELIEKERSLRQKIKFYENKKRNAPGVDIDEKATGEMIENYWRVRAEIRRENPQFASLIQPEAFSPEKIQNELLDEDSVLLEYVLGNEISYLFLVTKSSLEVIPLANRKEIERVGREYIGALKSHSISDSQETSAERSRRLRIADSARKKQGRILSMMLLGDAADKIGNKRLLIVGSGILQYIPFAALEDPRADSKTTFLIETNEIVNLPSASVLSVLREKERGKKTSADSIGILADPVFSKDDVRFKYASKEKLKNFTVENSTLALGSPKQLRSDFYVFVSAEPKRRRSPVFSIQKIRLFRWISAQISTQRLVRRFKTPAMFISRLTELLIVSFPNSPRSFYR